MHIEPVVDLLTQASRGIDLVPFKIVLQISLAGNVAFFDFVEVEKLQPRDSYGSELKC